MNRGHPVLVCESWARAKTTPSELWPVLLLHVQMGFRFTVVDPLSPAGWFLIANRRHFASNQSDRRSTIAGISITSAGDLCMEVLCANTFAWSSVFHTVNPQVSNCEILKMTVLTNCVFCYHRTRLYLCNLQDSKFLINSTANLHRFNNGVGS